MRCQVIVCLLVLALSPACGGATPSPKNEGDESPKSSSAPKNEAAASDDAGTTAEESKTSAAAPAPPASPPAASQVTPPSEDDPWMAPHQIPQKEVLQTMRAAQAKVQACHREGMKRDPSASGEVKIRFVVTHEGSVRVWKDQDSTMTDEDTTKCVGEVIKGLKFPKQKSPGDAWGIYKVGFSG